MRMKGGKIGKSQKGWILPEDDILRPGPGRYRLSGSQTSRTLNVPIWKKTKNTSLRPKKRTPGPGEYS